MSITEVDDNHYIIDCFDVPIQHDENGIPLLGRKLDEFRMPLPGGKIEKEIDYPTNQISDMNIDISTEMLKNILKKGIFSSKPQNSQPIFNAIHFSGHDGNLIIDSTDGTIFTRQTVHDGLFQGYIKKAFLLEQKHAKAIINLLSFVEEDSVNMKYFFDGKSEYLQLSCRMLRRNFIFSFKLLLGSFPDVNSLQIRQPYETYPFGDGETIYFNKEEVLVHLMELIKTKEIKKSSIITLTIPHDGFGYSLFYKSKGVIKRIDLQSFSQTEKMGLIFTLRISTWLYILDRFDDQISFTITGVHDSRRIVFSSWFGRNREIKIQITVKPYSFGVLDQDRTDELLFGRN